MEITGRCMRCKDTKTMKNIEIVKTKRGGFMAKGLCIECDCKMCKIMSKDNAKLLAESLNVALPE